MQLDDERLRQLAEDLRAWLGTLGNFNLVPVVTTPATATAVGRRLAEVIPAEPLDFDGQAIALMENAGWDRFLACERGSALQQIRNKLSETAARVRDLVAPDRPVVVFNVNLPVSMDFPELANELYQASTQGLIVLCVGGSVRGDRVLLHHTMALTGSGLVEPVDLTG